MQTYKRGEGQIKADRTLSDAYKVFVEQHGKKITEQEFRNIANAINKRIINGIIEGEEFTVPYGQGTLRIQRRKVNLNNPRVDFAEFNKTGKVVKHLNEHTGGYYFQFKWDKRLMYVKHKYFYSFISTRSNKNRLSALLKSGEKRKTDYFD